MCICEIGIGKTTRINARGIKLGTIMYFLLFMDSRFQLGLGLILAELNLAELIFSPAKKNKI